MFLIRFYFYSPLLNYIIYLLQGLFRKQEVIELGRNSRIHNAKRVHCRRCGYIGNIFKEDRYCPQCGCGDLQVAFVRIEKRSK